MSCFIMSDQAHAATANALEYILNSGFNRFGFDAPDSLYKALNDCRDRYGFYCSGLIFRRLYDLNSRAYAGRYKTDADTTPPEMPSVPPLVQEREREDQHEKQMSREGTLWNEYDEIKAILTKIEAVGSGPVDLADPHAREMLADQLQKLQSRLDESKALNAFYRKHKSFDGFPGMSAEAAAKLTASFADTKERCPWVKSPVPDYELTSLRGKIKRVQARLDELDKRAEAAEQPADGTKFPGGEIVRNLEADRLQILFDEKPDDETRQKLKERGFRWSPRYNAWQRKLTDNAMYDARRALGLTE